MERFIPVECFHKKNNASRGITFFQLLPKRPVFSVSFVFTSARLSCRGVAKNLPAFSKWHNLILFLFSVQKKKKKKLPVSFEVKFSSTFQYKW